MLDYRRFEAISRLAPSMAMALSEAEAQPECEVRFKCTTEEDREQAYRVWSTYLSSHFLMEHARHNRQLELVNGSCIVLTVD